MWKFWKKGTDRKAIHLDYASTTPVHASVLARMKPYFNEEWANPSAIYASGQRTRKAVEDVRVQVARLLRVRPQGILFTSGGTESNNQALIGLVERLHGTGRAYDDMHIVTTDIEHPSILETCTYLEGRGVKVSYVPVDEDGLIIEKEFSAALTEKTVLVSFSYVNSEVGVIQDVKRLTRLVRLFNEKHACEVLVHLDASQAPLWLPCEMDMLGVDLMTLDAGKCYGPKGVGVLALRHGVELSSFMHGGGQEGGLRSGTENTPLIVGCAAALSRAQDSWKERSATALLLRDYMMELIATEIPEAVINGSRTARVANNIHISIPGLDSEFTVVTLDGQGVAASTRSACGSISSSGSYVVRAMSKDEVRATSTVRFTLGEDTTREDIAYAISILKKHVHAMRSFAQSLTKQAV